MLVGQPSSGLRDPDRGGAQRAGHDVGHLDHRGRAGEAVAEVDFWERWPDAGADVDGGEQPGVLRPREAARRARALDRKSVV